MLFKIKKDLRSTKFQGNRSTTPPSIGALKRNNTRQSEDRLIGKGILTLQSLKNHNDGQYTAWTATSQGVINLQIDRRLRRSLRINKSTEIFMENLQWKVSVGEVPTAPWGRGSAIVWEKNAKTAAIERAVSFILKILIPEMGFFKWCFKFFKWCFKFCSFSSSYLYTSSESLFTTGAFP